ncbi:MAG: helix-turn-helix transcriptional regulator [Lentisphaeria bacterium]|nr:helix-turn-helix transcriptional regulator [Lentisphaeria bacterium]
MSDFVNLAPSELTPEQSVILLRAGYRKQLEQWSVNNCLQPCWVMWYNTAPGCSCISGGKEHQLTGKNILLIPPHTLYSGKKQASPGHYFLWFKTASPFDLPRRKTVDLPAAPFEERIRAAFAPGKFRLHQLYTLVSELLLAIPEEFFSSDSSTGKNIVINNAIRFINKHEGCVSNADIAAYLHLSQTRFSHLFKAEMDISPQRFCHQVRMYKAIQMLQEGCDIKTTAASCGYADRYHFSKEFKHYHNITPGKWLKMHLSKTGKK